MVLSIYNVKGGTAKTTSTINIGSILASKGYRVLLVDFTESAHLTMVLDLNRPTYNLSSVQNKDIKRPIINCYSDNLHIIPSFAYLKSQSNVQCELNKISLKQILNPYSAVYDYILFDCSPYAYDDLLEVWELTDLIFIPMETNQLSLYGLQYTLYIIDEIKESINPNLNLGGIFFTKKSTKISVAEYVKKHVREKYKDSYMKSSIRISSSAMESQITRKPILEFSPKSNLAKDYIRLTEEILLKTSNYQLSNNE